MAGIMEITHTNADIRINYATRVINFDKRTCRINLQGDFVYINDDTTMEKLYYNDVTTPSYGSAAALEIALVGFKGSIGNLI